MSERRPFTTMASACQALALNAGYGAGFGMGMVLVAMLFATPRAYLNLGLRALF